MRDGSRHRHGRPGVAAHHWRPGAIETFRELCAKTGTPLDAVSAIATIQPLPWYAAALADGLGVAPERVPTTFAEVVHLGSAGVVANLLEARRRGLLHDGASVVLYAHGAGMTRCGALLRCGREAAR